MENRKKKGTKKQTEMEEYEMEGIEKCKDVGR